MALMLEEDLISNSTFKFLARLVLLVLAIVGGRYLFLGLMHTFLMQSLGYHFPEQILGTSFDSWALAWILSFTLLIGIFFGTIGKIVDYTLIILFGAAAAFVFFGGPTSMIVGFIGVAFVGNVIGFGLKLLRQRFFFGGSKLGRL